MTILSQSFYQNPCIYTFHSVIDEAGHQEIETYSAALGGYYVVPMRRVYIYPISFYELETACSMRNLNPKKVTLNEHINIDPDGE